MLIIVVVVVVYNARFVMISIVVAIITVPITIMIVVMLVILVFIVVAIALIITRTINFIKILFLSPLSVILVSSFDKSGQKGLKVRGTLLKIILDEQVTIHRINCSIKFSFMMLAILKCLKLIVFVTLNSRVTFGVFAAF